MSKINIAWNLIIIKAKKVKKSDKSEPIPAKESSISKKSKEPKKIVEPNFQRMAKFLKGQKPSMSRLEIADMVHQMGMPISPQTVSMVYDKYKELDSENKVLTITSICTKFQFRMSNWNLSNLNKKWLVSFHQNHFQTALHHLWLRWRALSLTGQKARYALSFKWNIFHE